MGGRGRGRGGPKVRVEVSKDFAMMKTEVTQLQYFTVMGVNPSRFKKAKHCPDTFMIINNQKLCPNNPVEKVSWDDVQLFITKLNLIEGTSVYRLPTEAEWEYVGRAGTSGLYYYGSDDYNKYAWYDGKKTHAVGTKLASANGLFDIHGNVWEWVQDMYKSRLPGGVDPCVLTAPDWRGRVYRGGGFGTDSHLGGSMMNAQW